MLSQCFDPDVCSNCNLNFKRRPGDPPLDSTIYCKLKCHAKVNSTCQARFQLQASAKLRALSLQAKENRENGLAKNLSAMEKPVGHVFNMIFKLDQLNAFGCDIDDLSSFSIPLCCKCIERLTDLYKAYAEFIVCTAKESFLQKCIDELDATLIRARARITSDEDLVSVKCEVEIPEQPSPEDCEPIFYESHVRSSSAIDIKLEDCRVQPEYIDQFAASLRDSWRENSDQPLNGTGPCLREDYSVSEYLNEDNFCSDDISLPVSREPSPDLGIDDVEFQIRIKDEAQLMDQNASSTDVSLPEAVKRRRGRPRKEDVQQPKFVSRKVSKRQQEPTSPAKVPSNQPVVVMKRLNVERAAPKSVKAKRSSSKGVVSNTQQRQPEAARAKPIRKEAISKQEQTEVIVLSDDSSDVASSSTGQRRSTREKVPVFPMQIFGWKKQKQYKPKGSEKAGKQAAKKKLEKKPKPKKTRGWNLKLIKRTGALSESTKAINHRYMRKKTKYANPCWHCKEHFETPAECAAHTKEKHLTSGSVMCEVCSRVCRNQNVLLNHLAHCSKFCPGEIRQPFACEHCPKKFGLRRDFNQHILRHGERNFACEDCSFKTTTNFLLQLHVKRMHSGIVTECLTCPECGKNLKGKSNLKLHIDRIHTPGGRERYQEYAKKCNERSNRRRAERRAAQPVSTICAVCAVDCLSERRLTAHMRLYHPGDVKKGNIVCEVCGKDFRHANGLRVHMEFAHTEDRPFICEQCGRSYKTMHNLRDHVQHTHSEEGRLKYNEKMRLHQRRRKMVASAMAQRKKELMAGAPPSTPKHVSEAQTAPDAPIDFSHSRVEPSSNSSKNTSSSVLNEPSVANHMTLPPPPPVPMNTMDYNPQLGAGLNPANPQNQTDSNPYNYPFSSGYFFANPQNYFPG